MEASGDPRGVTVGPVFRVRLEVWPRREKGWRSDIIGQSGMELVLFWAGWAERFVVPEVDCRRSCQMSCCS